MWICTQAFHVPKRGNAETEYEDAFFPDTGFASRDLTKFRCAVADGASESAYSGLWAQLLVRAFGRRKMRLERLRNLWQRAVVARPVPWYLERKIRNGAHAAFVGLMLREEKGTPKTAPKDPLDIQIGEAATDSGSWRAMAVGDSCVFHVRGDQLLSAGPVTRSEHFDNNPVLVSSRSRDPFRQDSPNVQVLKGRWEPGDTFHLATDALAQWLLSKHEAQKPPWSALRDLDTDDPGCFASFIDELRSGDDLHNDDTTLVRVEVGG